MFERLEWEKNFEIHLDSDSLTSLFLVLTGKLKKNTFLILKKTTYYRDSYLPQFINQQLNVVACKFKQIFVSLRPKSTLNHECTNKNMFQQFYVQFPIKNKETHKLCMKTVCIRTPLYNRPTIHESVDAGLH